MWWNLLADSRSGWCWASVPLMARSMVRLKAQRIQHLLDRGLAGKPVEVDPRHGLSRPLPLGSYKEERSAHVYIWGTRNGAAAGQSMGCQPAAVRRTRPAWSNDWKASPGRSFVTEGRIPSGPRSSLYPPPGDLCRCCLGEHPPVAHLDDGFSDPQMPPGPDPGNCLRAARGLLRLWALRSSPLQRVPARRSASRLPMKC